MVFKLDDDELWFPAPQYGEEDGFIAIGGDLSFDRLLLAYTNGFFPWYDFRKSPEICWYCPVNRFVIFPPEVHISHSMRTLINKKKYEVTVNKDFEGVIRNCSRLRYDEEGAWLGEDMIEAYINLHKEKFAASVEVWNENGELCGGLYGVTINRCFIGESMFSIEPNTSKLALIFLAMKMRRMEGSSFIDCQLETPHLKSMGGRYISYETYIRILKDLPQK